MERPVFTVRWSEDAAQADWFIPRLHPFAQDVGSFIPEGFDAYCRIFHPAWRTTPAGREKLRWHDVAALAGRIAHPTMQFDSIRTPEGEQAPLQNDEIQEPHEGTMPSDELAVLTDHLRAATVTVDSCWFCIWEGYGELSGGTVYMAHQAPVSPVRFDGTHLRIGPWKVSIPYLTDRLVGEQHRRAREQWRREATNPPPDYATAKRVKIPGRAYFLYQGSIDEAIVLDKGTNHPRMANMWWPEDRSWFVSTEIDFCWTFVGGTKKLIASILDDDRLEALPIKLTDRVTIDADQVNGPNE